MIPHRRDNIAPTAKQMDIKTPENELLRIYGTTHLQSMVHGSFALLYTFRLFYRNKCPSLKTVGTTLHM